MINLIGCCFEGNGGAGVYLTGHPVNFNFSGCYFEQNARTILNATANKPATQGTSQPATAPTPIGRAASIIEDADFGQWSVVFDNIYVHKRNGVWLKGKGTNTPITFKHMVRPTVIWSEHGNWEMIDCKVDHPVTLAPGIMVTDAKLVAQGILWIDPTNSPPSGHPGYFTTRGVRKVAPAPSDGLDLYVDTDNGDDRNDGRTATKAWKSLAKAMGMYSNTVLDTPVTIHLAGEADSQFTLSNVSGTGVMTLKCTASAKLTNGLIADVGCRIVIEAAGQLQAAGLTVQSSPAVRINGVRFVLSDEPALICQDASNVVVSDCDFSGPADSTAILADSHARLYVDSTDIVQRVVARNGAAIETASQATSCD